jgi:hypothetical protein
MRFVYYEYFIEKIIKKNVENNSIFFKNTEVRLRNLIIRYDFVKLLNNITFIKIFQKKTIGLFLFYNPYLYKYKKYFNIERDCYDFSFLSIDNFIKTREYLIYFYRRILNPFFFNNLSKVDILIFVDKKKFVNYFNILLENSNLKYKFLILNIKDQVNFGLDKSNSIVLPNPPIKEILFFKKEKYAYFSFFHKSFYNLFEILKPKIFISIESDNIISEIGAQTSKYFGIKSVCFQWGAFVQKIPRLSLQEMSFSFFFSWGKLFSNYLRKFNKNTQFLELGYFNYKKLKKTNRIIFALQRPYETLPINYTVQLVYMANIIANRYKNWQIVIREHPDFSVNKILKNIELNKSIIIEKNNISLSESLSKSKIVVGLNSSILIESLLFNCLPFYIELKGYYKFYPDLSKKKLGVSYTSFEELENKLNKFILGDDIKYNNLNNKKLFFSTYGKLSKKLILLKLKELSA